MEYTPNEEKTTDYIGIITNLFNYFSLGIDDKVTPQGNTPDVQRAGRATPHPRNSIQQVVYNLKLKRSSNLKISTRFGLDAPVMQNKKGFDKERREEDNASTNVHPKKSEGETNTRDSSAENCLNGSGERRKKKKKKKNNAENRDNQYTSSFDLSGGEFFQLKEQSGDEGGEESKVEKSKEKRKKKKEKGKEKSKKKKKKSKREEEEENTKEKIAAENGDESKLDRGMEETKRNGGCDKTGEGDEPHREEETVNFGENGTGGVCVEEEMKKTKTMKKVKKMKKKKTRREEMKVNETSSTENDSAENASAQMQPARRTNEQRNPPNTRKGNHNHVRKKKSTTLSSSFVQPPCRSNSDEANFLHVVDEADSQRKDFVKAQDELAINYISDSKKSYISIRSRNRDKDNVIQLPKLNLSTRGGRSSSGEENETTDGEDVLIPLAELHQ